MKPSHALASVAVVATLVVGSATLSAVTKSEPAAVDLGALKAKYQRPSEVPFPADNPFSEAKYELGHKLFFEPRVSTQANMSCATCHNPALGWGDGMPTGTGHGAKKLGRRSPSILNLAWGEPMMWDGRLPRLEEQALGPIQAEGEMNMSLEKLVSLLTDIPGYRRLFEKSFPNADGIQAADIGKAIAVFERTIVSGEAPFDRWVKGDEKAIDEQAKRGFVVFNGKGHCSACHSGWRFTDDSFHDIGLKSDDFGRGKFVPDVPLMQHAFKTPGLRNIVYRGPYMHDGSVQTLDEVIVHYDTGYIERDSLSPEMRRLNLTAQERKDLVAFMRTLTSEDKPVPVPTLPTKEAY